jgi:hypothetical protein
MRYGSVGFPQVRGGTWSRLVLPRPGPAATDWRQEWRQGVGDGFSAAVERGFDRGGDLIPHRGEDVLIGIHRERDGGVTERLGDHLRVDAGT